MADMGTIRDAYLAEHPADDEEPITEEWLRLFASMEILGTKRLGYIVAQVGVLTIEWCPVCGDLEPVLCLEQRVLFWNPNRGQLRRLLAALGYPIKE